MKPEEFMKLPKDQQDMLIAKMADIEKLAKEIVAEDSKLPQLSMKEFEERIKGVMEGYIKNMTHVDKKHFAFPGIGNDPALLDDNSGPGKFKKTMKFLKALSGGDVQTLRSMDQIERVNKNLTEGNTTAGGFLVPDEFMMEVQRLVPDYGVIRRNVRIIPMRFDTINIPASGTTENSAIWTAEGAQILQTDPTFRQLTLTINKLAALPVLSNELLADADIPIIQYLADIISSSFASEEDNQGFNGTGSPFVGLLSATGVPTTPLASGTAMTMLSYPELVKMTTNIYSNATAGAKFYFHRSMLGHMRSRISTTGQPILAPNQNELAGFPFEAAERLPSTSHASANVGTFPFAIFGNLSRAMAMGERGSMTMKIGEEGTVAGNNLFEKDMICLRVIERVALGVLLPSAYTRLTT